jgi:sugar phosphate isomerase/epimerase
MRGHGVRTFRLGSTSYVYPAGLLENVRRLAGTVSDVELILFESEGGPGNIPGDDELAQLRLLAGEKVMTYTVHLPLDLRGDHSLDSRMWRLTEKVLHTAAPLEPWAWVFHLDGEGVTQPGWREQALVALDRLCGMVADPATLALENLESYAPDVLEWLFARAPMSRTLDVGHLWKAGLKPLEYLPRWLPDCRVIHLHGCEMRDGVPVDHLSLGVVAVDEVAAVLAAMAGWSGVLTLEVFEDDFFASLATLNAAQMKLQ